MTAPSAFQRGPETYPLVGVIGADERVVITGASGWLGRSLLHELEAALGDRLSSQVLALGSSPRTIRLGSGRAIDILKWEHDAVASWGPTAAIHLAYLTRERIAEVGLPAYLEANLRVTAQAALLQALPGMRAFVAASSGAAACVDWASAFDDNGAYGALKRMDEALFLREGEFLGVPTVIARTWSVSGPYCTKPFLFAFSDFITQAQSTGRIVVRAEGEVWRRYVDAGQYLALCLRSSIAGGSGVIGSTGPMIEIRELAQAVAEVMEASVLEAEITGTIPVQRYLLEGADLEERARVVDVRLLDLAEQIAFTGIGLVNRWGASGALIG